MANNDKWYLENSEPSLRMWIFQQMSYGALVAGAVFFGVIALILLLVAISGWLPDDPYAALMIGKATVTALT